MEYVENVFEPGTETHASNAVFSVKRVQRTKEEDGRSEVSDSEQEEQEGRG